MHIPVVDLQGMEADDIIGTLASRLKEDLRYSMVTPDKILDSWSSENIFNV